MKSDKKAYTVSQSLSLKVEQDDEYVIIKLFNSKEEYEMILFSSNDELSEDQKMSLSAIINKFYSKIWLIKKEYSSELWNTAYENILETLQEETKFIAYEERISLLWHQIILIDQKIMKIVKF